MTGINDLHARYAPVLHLSRGERFLPMSVSDFLGYAALYQHGASAPVVAVGRVRPADLVPSREPETFLRSVDAGPLEGVRVAAEWGIDTLKLLAEWTSTSRAVWSEEAARRIYGWFSDKTRDATRHFWWNRLLLGGATRNSAPTADLPRFKLPGEVRDAALANYRRVADTGNGLAYYYRLQQQGDYLNLQYWFFYAYNDWAQSFNGFNDHEGDWEGIQLFFHMSGGRPVEPPAYICYQGHHSRITKPWEHPDVTRSDTHPHVYVAAGSHASYPERKTYTIMSLYNLIDYATGEEMTIEADDWRTAVDLDAAEWVTAYRGSWGTRYRLSAGALGQLARGLGLDLAGEMALPGVSAPRGPRYDDEGGERATWSDTLAFAGIEQS